FEQGAVDYLLKPIETARLAQALGRVRARLAQPPADLSALLEQLKRGNDSERLQWITVLQGRDIQFIAVDDVCYFRADNKYIAVVTAAGESLITTPLKELVARLDPAIFWQVHRGVIVNMHAVQSVRRSITGQLDLKLKARPETLRVSAGYAHLFKHM
nr:response regulator transcription factor [Caldimonas sp.]